MALAFRHDVGRNFRFVIARVTGAPVHVALVFPSDVWRVFIHADSGGVSTGNADDLLRSGEWTVVPVPVEPADAERAFAFAQQQVGKPYNWAGTLVAWWIGRIGGNGWRNHWFCSQLAVATLQAAGLDVQPARAAAWTPRRLWNWVQPWRTA
jgi:uncharacterized protein YycO